MGMVSDLDAIGSSGGDCLPTREQLALVTVSRSQISATGCTSEVWCSIGGSLVLEVIVKSGIKSDMGGDCLPTRGQLT